MSMVCVIMFVITMNILIIMIIEIIMIIMVIMMIIITKTATITMTIIIVIIIIITITSANYESTAQQRGTAAWACSGCASFQVQILQLQTCTLVSYFLMRNLRN